MTVRKVVFVTNIITPYLIPLFNYLAKQRIDFRVLSVSEREQNREWIMEKKHMRFTYDILPGIHWFVWQREFPLHINWGVWTYFLRHNPDTVIVSGWSVPAYWEAFLYCKIFGKKFILWNGTTLLSTGSITGPISWVTRIMIKGADRCVTYGTKAAEYLEYMGAQKERIYIGINTVDVEWFKAKVTMFRRSENIKEDRNKYPPLLLLYVGRLVKKKGVLQVLKAIQGIHSRDIGFLIVGSGPQAGELKRFCRHYNISNVYFTGFQQTSDLPMYYALADVLIFPSFYDVWGLVINEALASGLYVLSSNRVGAAYDLVHQPWNGLLFDPNDVGEIVSAIKYAKENIGDIRARRLDISEWAVNELSIAKAGDVFIEAITT